MSNENRKHPRFTLNQLVELDIGRETIVQAEGVNISESGLLCVTKELCDPGTRVYLMITVDPVREPHTVEFEGVVIRSVKSGKTWDTAINITSISDNDHRALAGFIKKLQ